MNQIDTQQALSRAMALCSKAEKCKSEIHKKLQTWGVASNDAPLIIDALEKQKFIDEERFARYYVRDKYRFNKWGRVKINYMLRGLKISNEHIEAGFSEIDEGEYLHTLDDLLGQKLKGLKFVNTFDRDGKLMRFAQSRGFESDLIVKALSKLKIK